jgi:hypothetical protein
MSAAEAALKRGAEAAGPLPSHASVHRESSLRREMYVREFTSHYDIRPEQIFFDDKTDEPWFDFEALSLLVNQLADIPSIAVTRGAADPVTGMIDANCTITLPNDRSRAYVGSAQIGEPMPNGGTVESWRQALALAQVRALRTALRSVSFDPVRAHEAAKRGEAVNLNVGDPRSKMLAEAHLHGETLGYIVGDDKSKWRSVVSLWSRGRTDTSAQLEEPELGHFVIYLRGLVNARSRGADAAGVGQS